MIISAFYTYAYFYAVRIFVHKGGYPIVISLHVQLSGLGYVIDEKENVLVAVFGETNIVHTESYGTQYYIFGLGLAVV